MVRGKPELEDAMAAQFERRRPRIGKPEPKKGTETDSGGRAPRARCLLSDGQNTAREIFARAKTVTLADQAGRPLAHRLPVAAALPSPFERLIQ